MIVAFWLTKKNVIIKVLKTNYFSSTDHHNHLCYDTLHRKNVESHLWSYGDGDSIDKPKT